MKKNSLLCIYALLFVFAEAKFFDFCTDHCVKSSILDTNFKNGKKMLCEPNNLPKYKILSLAKDNKVLTPKEKECLDEV